MIAKAFATVGSSDVGRTFESLSVHRFQVCRKSCCAAVNSFAVDAAGVDSELSGRVGCCIQKEI